MIYWQCTMCRRLKCRARAITHKGAEETVYAKNLIHNHTIDSYLKRSSKLPTKT